MITILRHSGGQAGVWFGTWVDNSLSGYRGFRHGISLRNSPASWDHLGFRTLEYFDVISDQNGVMLISSHMPTSLFATGNVTVL